MIKLFEMIRYITLDYVNNDKVKNDASRLSILQGKNYKDIGKISL